MAALARVLGLFRLAAVFAMLSIYFVFAPFGYFAFWLYSMLPTRKPLRRARILQWVVRAAFRTMFLTMRLLRIASYRRRNIEGLPEGPFIIVANHPTLLDAAVMLATFERTVTTVKPQLFRSFWAKPLLSGCGHIDGGSAVAVQDALESAKARMEEGFNLLVFPEGTRSPKDGTHRFGRFAFELAAQTKAPIVPIAINVTPRWLSPHIGFFRLFGSVPRVSVSKLQVVDSTDCVDDSRELRDMVENRICKELKCQAKTPQLKTDSSTLS